MNKKSSPEMENHFSTTSTITLANRLDHLFARLGIRRSRHRVEPGLYTLGNPGKESPVFVSANYTLSFDVLRSSLAGIDGYILVLDTKGINVWCAAGKGTFGTDELIERILSTSLESVVDHRKVILPQLGAPGVSAHQVRKFSGFAVEYGPVRAKDLPRYLQRHRATPDMRRVKFPVRDRLILIPVEFVSALLPTLAVAILLYFTGNPRAALAAVTAFVAGIAFFPLLLPWLPTVDFSSKGYFLGMLAATPFVVLTLLNQSGLILLQRIGIALAYMLCMPVVTAFISLNFTGSTTFTSRTGVEKEIYTYIPAMAWSFGSGLVLSIAVYFIRLFGG